MRQYTLVKDVSITGKGLHTGEDVTVTLKPAPVGHGVVFQRTDLIGQPRIVASVAHLGQDLMRATALSSEGNKVSTPEHILSALRGLGIDNVLIEMNGSELPILDGSAKGWVNLIHQAEWVEQEADREEFVLEAPVTVTDGNRSMIALPYDGFKITCTSADDYGRHTQHLSLEIDRENYITQIGGARTFVFYEEIEPLLKLGKIKGGSIDSAIVIKGDQILSKEPLRFKDELVRHKILDIIGDLSLIGKSIRAHIIAVRPGHSMNAKLALALAEKMAEKAEEKKTGAPKAKPQSQMTVVTPLETQMDVRRIQEVLPHRYPFLLVDRVVAIDDEKMELTAIKNVTINEPFFQGHFPGLPVMPGVLQVEAMAQAAGLLMLRKVAKEGVIAFFMSCDQVKFRQAVTPGDQLVIKVKLLKTRGTTLATAEGKCYVGEKCVSSAELMFTLAKA